MARTNIPLDDSLVRQVQRLTHIKTRRALVDFSLRELARREKQKQLLKLKGKIEWKGNLDKSRQGKEYEKLLGHRPSFKEFLMQGLNFDKSTLSFSEKWRGRFRISDRTDARTKALKKRFGL